MPTDPLSPPPPEAPYFDQAAGAWILSRYADVLAAFRETRLWPIGQRGERIAQGQQVNLMIGSANRDPQQYPDPDRLDIARRVTAHATLGIARNSCIGATLIRMASAATTGALLRDFAMPGSPEPWNGALDRASAGLPPCTLRQGGFNACRWGGGSALAPGAPPGTF